MIRRPALVLLALSLAACTPEQSIGDDGPRDAGLPDAASPDAASPDAASPDAGSPDADAAIPDADLSGTYTVTLTNNENGCAFRAGRSARSPPCRS